MPNQMIALQARAPQTPNIANMFIQRNQMRANEAIMKEKQDAVARAAAFRQLVSSPDFDPNNADHLRMAAALDPTGAERIGTMADNRRKATEEYVSKVSARARDALQMLRPGDVAGAQAIRNEIVQAIPAWDKVIAPADQWTPEYIDQLEMTAEQHINKKYPTPSASVGYTTDNQVKNIVVGGLPGVAGTYDMPDYAWKPDTPAPKAKVPAPKAPKTPKTNNIAPKVAPSAAPGAVNKGGAPGDFGWVLPDANMRANGLPGKNIAFTPDTAPQIIQAATQTKMIDADHLQQLRAALGPENDQHLADWMKSNGIQIDVSKAPGRTNASYEMPAGYGGLSLNSDTGEIPFRQDTGYVPSATRPSFKNPMQSPSQVPSTAGAVSSAEESGKENVRVRTQPQIAGGSKAAELKAQKDADFPAASSRLQSTLTLLDQKLEDARALRNHKGTPRIIGQLDAIFPSIGDAASAQQLYDTVTAQGLFSKMQEEKSASATGGLVGNMSDSDRMALERSVGALGRAQPESGFFTALDKHIANMETARKNAIDAYRREYKGYRPDWGLYQLMNRRPAPGAAPRGKNVGGGFIVTEVHD